MTFEEDENGVVTITNIPQDFFGTKEEQEEEQKLWCQCGYEGEDTTYVENYLGVRHGWICPKCKKYVQIG